MKKQATEEQKARAAERRERFGVFCKQVADMSDGERAELLAKVGAVLSCEGQALSDINTALLVLQRGGLVSVVGGFRQWRKVGRYVMRGQRGSSIWIPKSKGEGAVDPDKRPGEISSRELAQADKRRFFLGTVFDISQTAEFGADGASHESAEDSEGGEVVESPAALSIPRLGYGERVLELESEGCCTSDAQSVADVELSRGLLLLEGGRE